MSKKANDALRAQYVSKIIEAFKVDEDVLRVDSNKVAFPVVDCEGEDNWVVITITIPTGTRDGDAYDGYSEAESYQMKVAENERKAAENAIKKQKKIERDQKLREQKAAQRANHPKTNVVE